MQTYSHLIITAVLGRTLKDKQQGKSDGVPQLTLAGRPLPPLHSRALLLGSLAPDIPLILLTIVFVISDLWAGRRLGPDADPAQFNVAYLFDYLYFNNRWVMTLQNLFHGPIVILLYIALGYLTWRRGVAWGAILFWFAVSCGLHTLIDIPLHTDDGPLIFFPFYWEARFRSPISYWDSRYYGNQWSIFEHLLVAGMLIYLLVRWWLGRKAKPGLAGS
ncbi:MAG: hypothetical protein M3Q45_13085 [Chloroflexota bacterium]|nr:hypothetical protein [Chloroflexota bacterium]